MFTPPKGAVLQHTKGTVMWLQHTQTFRVRAMSLDGHRLVSRVHLPLQLANPSTSTVRYIVAT